MPETNIQNQNNNPVKAYTLKKSGSTFWLKVLEWINLVLNFFSLKQSTQFWGIVYDSISKQPLDPVIVKLMYVDGREFETCVTDIAGRYGFLARPGKFKIYVRKTNYLFPSRYAAGQTDGIYENLYHGEFFTLEKDYEVLAPNIPMDPVNKDWNQGAKLKVIRNYPYVKYFFKVLAALVFWFGFILDGVLIYKTFPRIPLALYQVAGIYLALLLLSIVLPETRLWGQLKTDIKLPTGEFFFLELRDLKFREISFGKAKVKDGGKFLLRANKGSYVLAVSLVNKNGDKKEMAELPVSIGGQGVFNSTILLK
jgi:hypothetical protein